MSNIRVDVDYTIRDGLELKFRSPVDCSQITGLIVYYPGEDGNTASKVFALSDAHGNNVGDIDNLFAEDVVVKVILDVTKGMAFVQNADTNAYLEAQLASKRPNTWLPTIAEIGAAPAGFGLGANGASNATAYTVVDRAGADNLGHSGLYWFYDNANPIFPSGWNNGGIGLIEHQQHSLYHVVNARQVFYPGYNGDNGESTSHLVRVKNYAGVWQPWEWVDPPMFVNTEYRTTERWCGRPVFTMLVDCDYGPNKNITETPIPIPEGAGYFERAIFCSIHGANSSIVMPVMGFDVTADFGCGGILGNIIRISSNVDGSSIHYYATVKYLKQGI